MKYNENTTLKDLFNAKKEYLFTIKIGKNLWLYVEGLDGYGCAIAEDSFDINLIGNFCIEVGNNTDFEPIHNIGITLNTKIEDIIKRARAEYDT
jgi:hypothetical protein